MTGNLSIWDALGKTDPEQTKPFNRAGGFRGTSVKPMWVYRRLTEQFGPVGIGWGHNKPDFTVINGDGGEVLVYCAVECWHTDRANTFYGVGGDKVVAKNKNGLFHDDEAFKKAFTDAVMNAFKSVGVAADIHMGRFDDDKYVDDLRAEIAAKNAPPRITDEQRDELIDMASAAGFDAADVAKAAKVRAVSDIPADQFDGLKKRLADAMTKEAA